MSRTSPFPIGVQRINMSAFLLMAALILLVCVGMIASKPSDPCEDTTESDRDSWTHGITYVLKSPKGYNTFLEFLKTRTNLKSKVPFLKALKDEWNEDDWVKLEGAYKAFKKVLRKCP
uniref:Uncharacterized protein n=1 Tax=Cacopsylla melanoneura TaxID=428564 RepID=A0A8D8XVT1_9HEMI